MAQAGPNVAPKCPQSGFKMTSRWPPDGIKMRTRREMLAKCSENVATNSQEAENCVFSRFLCNFQSWSPPPEWPKMAPTMGPRGPKMAHDGRKMPQDGHTTAPDAPT